MSFELTDHQGTPITIDSDVDPVTNRHQIRHALPTGAATDAKVQSLIDSLSSRHANAPETFQTADAGLPALASPYETSDVDAAGLWAGITSAPATGKRKTFVGFNFLLQITDGSLYGANWDPDVPIFVQISETPIGAAAPVLLYQELFSYNMVRTEFPTERKGYIQRWLPFPIIAPNPDRTLIYIVGAGRADTQTLPTAASEMTFKATLSLYMAEV